MSGPQDETWNDVDVWETSVEEGEGLEDYLLSGGPEDDDVERDAGEREF
jgi:hypothetical protein